MSDEVVQPAQADTGAHRHWNTRSMNAPVPIRASGLKSPDLIRAITTEKIIPVASSSRATINSGL